MGRQGPPGVWVVRLASLVGPTQLLQNTAKAVAFVPVKALGDARVILVVF